MCGGGGDNANNESYADRNKKMADDNKLDKKDKGIKWERSCTDILCCLIFLVFLVAMVGCSFWALNKGDPERILTPFDSVGNACGRADQCSSTDYAWPQGEACPSQDGDVNYEGPYPEDSGKTQGEKVIVPKARDFTAYKYKYFTLTSPSFESIFTAVCVKSCPGGDTYSAKEETGTCQLSGGGGEKDTDFTVQLSVKSMESCRNKCFMNKNCEAYEYDATTKNCNIWTLTKASVQASKTIVGSGSGTEKCHIKQTDTMSEIDFMDHDGEKGYGGTGKLFALFPTKQYQYLDTLCLPTEEVGKDILDAMLKSFDESSGMVKYLVQLGECWQVLLGMCGGTIVISIVYIFLLKWITKPLLYTSMLLILIGFVLLGGWCWMKKDEYDKVTQEQDYNIALGGAIAAWSVGGIYLCFIICCWKNISLGASIMEAASTFVTSNLRVLWLPVLSYITCVPYIIYWVVTAVFLYSIGEPYFNGSSPFAEIRWEDNTRYMWWFFLFGLLWSVAFIICVQQFMIAATVCQWYFSGQGAEMADSPYTTSVFRSFKWGIWYHCGSIAFGSFLIALITFIRIIFEYIVYQYEKVGNKENPVYKCFKCYIRYVLWCLDKYVKFITKNAFIQIALQSTNFCSAAWTSFYLIIRHAGRFSAAALTGWIMMMLGKGTIMGASTYLTFLLVKEVNPEVQQPLLPAAVILLVAYMVGSMFLSIFSFACTAILHCFILDEDTGGSEMTPESLQPFLDMNDAKAAKEGRFQKVDGNNQSQTGNTGKTNDMN